MSEPSDAMKDAVRESLAPFVVTPELQRLFDLRAVIYAGKCSLVWKLVKMRGEGENETQECRRLAMNCILGCGPTRDFEKLKAIRASGKGANPRFVALKGVLEHWKARWHKVQMELEAKGAV